METRLSEAVLRNAQRVDILCIEPPAGAWRDRIAPFLAHKGQPWNWQIEGHLDGRNDDLEQRFYVAAIEGKVVSQMMLVEKHRVAMLGHVFTAPAWRNQGATSALMKVMTEDFASRDGIAMYLHSAIGSQSYRIYSRFGFVPMYPGSDVLCWIRQPARFDALFDPSPVHVERVSWTHWPLVHKLMARREGDLLRNASLGLVGQCTAEDGFVMLMSQLRSGPPLAGAVLINQSGMAVGFATLLTWRQLPSRLIQLDVYAHPGAIDDLGLLIEAIELPGDRPVVAQIDSESAERREALEAAGFREVWRASRALVAGDRELDMILLER
jgi:GNAT superfamily N-acetyltransferase